MTLYETLVRFVNADAKVLKRMDYKEITRNQIRKAYDVNVCYFTRMMNEHGVKMRRPGGTYESFVYGDPTNQRQVLFNVESLIEVTDAIIAKQA